MAVELLPDSQFTDVRRRPELEGVRQRIQRAIYAISEAALTAPTLQELYAAIYRIVGELMSAAEVCTQIVTHAFCGCCASVGRAQHCAVPTPRSYDLLVSRFRVRFTGGALELPAFVVSAVPSEIPPMKASSLSPVRAHAVARFGDSLT